MKSIKHMYNLYISRLYDTMKYKVDCSTLQMSPKEYGQKLLNRKRGKK